MMRTRMMVAILDGGPSDEAIIVIGNWASKLRATVVGLGVIDENVWAPAPVTGSTSDQMGELPATGDAKLARARKCVAGSLEKLATHCHEARVDYRHAQEIGAPEEMILTEGQRHDVLVLAKQMAPDPGVSLPTRMVLEDTLHHTPRPILAMPEHPPDASAILVAYDGSLQSARALQGLVGSGMADLGDITVLSIDEKSQESAERHADLASDYLAAHDLHAQRRVVTSKRPTHEVILAEAKACEAAMIVMGAFGRRRLVDFFFGSVTKRMIDESPLPLFLFH